MAKRRVEPLVCHVPFKRYLPEPLLLSPRAPAPERRPRAEAVSAALKWKLEETEAPPGKRPRLCSGSPWAEQSEAAGRWRRGGLAAPQGEWAAPGGAGGRSKERAAAEQEEFCQYNSFLYWRAPLPTLDLSDIRDLDGETVPETKTPSRADTVETEMET